MGLKSYSKKTQLIKTLLEIKKPRMLVMTDDLKRIFKIDNDQKALQLAEKLRHWHILKYFNLRSKASGGYQVTDYAEDQLENRLKWEQKKTLNVA